MTLPIRSDKSEREMKNLVEKYVLVQGRSWDFDPESKICYRLLYGAMRRGRLSFGRSGPARYVPDLRQRYTVIVFYLSNLRPTAEKS